jgi:hypothetical protein
MPACAKRSPSAEPGVALRIRAAALALLGSLVIAAVCPVTASAIISFNPAPNAPNLPTVALNGSAQTDTATMANWGVSETLSLSGWNVTVAGDTGSGKSPVFKQYCPSATCGSHSGPGYITGGHTLPAGSLRLDSSGADWTGNILTKPSHLCNSGCGMDTTTPVKIANKGSVGALGTWTTTGYSSSSLSLSVPTTIRALTEPGEVYRVDLVWTLSTGP